MLAVAISYVCLSWYLAIVIVCTVGYVQIYLHYRSQPASSVSESLPIEDVPHITVIRPAKGLEPNLYECLAATFHQTYPKSKLTVRFCISDRNDPALPILQQLIHDFPAFDARILVEDEDPVLHGLGSAGLGPNPKIRNMSRAYREAKGELVWIIDCNVWVGRGVAGRMVDRLCGYNHDGPTRGYKFVHQLPLVVDITRDLSRSADRIPLRLQEEEDGHQVASSSTSLSRTVSNQQYEHCSLLTKLTSLAGGRLEEIFLSSSHAKFYTAINTVLVAPCIVGKSNMFRRSHLNYLTSQDAGRPTGIDYFSYNICEDHLIGELLWKGHFPVDTFPGGDTLGNHAMVFGDLAVQPMAGMSIAEYTARRVRWLRVRKFTVTMATLVEPGTESFLCSLYGAFAVTTVPQFHVALGVPSTWSAFCAAWLLSVGTWAAVDWGLYLILHSMASIETDSNTPKFVRGRKHGNKRSFLEWLPAWLGREALALPVWTWAVYGGVTVKWRGKKFWVGTDMKVHAIDDDELRRGASKSRKVSAERFRKGIGNGKARKE